LYRSIDQEKFDLLLQKTQQLDGPMMMETYTASGVPLLCELPEIVIGETGMAEPSVSGVVASVPSFLASLRSQCMRHIDGWWTYEFCFGKQVRQFHLTQQGKVEGEYILGRVTDPLLGIELMHELETSEKALIQTLEGIKIDKPDLPYYSELYEFGTECDLEDNKLRRQVELHWSCSLGASISSIRSIKEPMSCQYIMEIETPLICQHPSYRSSEIPLLATTCYFVSDDPTMPTTHKKHTTSSTQSADDEEESSSSTEQKETSAETESKKTTSTETGEHAATPSSSQTDSIGLQFTVVDDIDAATQITSTLIESVKKRTQGKVSLATTKENTALDSDNADDYEILTETSMETMLNSLSDSELLMLLSTIDEALSFDMPDENDEKDEEDVYHDPQDRIVISIGSLSKEQPESYESTETETDPNSNESDTPKQDNPKN
jgi:hypothetical protein